MKLSAETNGSILLSEVIQLDELQTRVDDGLVKVSEGQTNINNWWNGLTEVQQKNPINKAKFETANRVLETTGNVLNSVDGALNDENSATVQYSLNKRPKDMWNFIIGSQYQINKHLMLRAEYGFLKSRTQFMAGIQYRFGL